MKFVELCITNLNRFAVLSKTKMLENMNMKITWIIIHEILKKRS